jgi:hypothetical protein
MNIRGSLAYGSIVIIRQLSRRSGTASPIAYGASLINFESHQEELVPEAYRTWAKLFELYRYYSWVVDRFHISTQAWQLIYAKRHCDFTWLETRFGEGGISTHILLATPRLIRRSSKTAPQNLEQSFPVQ